jgi:tetratricopeptide (TPR) repeat protein
MKKSRKSNRSRSRKQKTRNKAGSSVAPISRGRRRSTNDSIGTLGLYSREYPPQSIRQKDIARVEKIAEETRTSDDWWILGEYKVVDGVLEENEQLINDGVQALMYGADHERPSPACMADLAYIQIFKNLDSFALPYLDKAVKLAPDSRDIWLLKGIAHTGLGQRDEAIDSLERAVSLPASQTQEKDLLNNIRGGKNLSELRASFFFDKIDPFDPRNIFQYSENESAKWIIFQLNQILKNDPNNVSVIIGLADTRYYLNQFDEAINLYNKALTQEINPSSAAHCCCALALISKKTRAKDDDAFKEVSFYQEALRKDPNHILSLVNLTSCLQSVGEYVDARILFERLFQQDCSDSPYYHTVLGNFGNNVGVIDKDFSREAELHLEAIKYCPNEDVDALTKHRLNAVRSLLCSNQIQTAKENWSKWKTQLANPRNANAHRSGYDFLRFLYEIFVNRRWFHPSFDLDYCQILRESGLTFAELRPIIERCWSKREKLFDESLVNRSDRYLADKNEPSLRPQEIDFSRLKNLTGENTESLRNLYLSNFVDRIGLIASNAGLHQLALEIWRTGSELPPGEDYAREAFVHNMVTELVYLDRESEALTLAENMPKPDGLRGWTILGNARMDNGLNKAAIEAYAKAIVTDEQFLLPYSNAVDCAYRSKSPTDLEVFRKKLESGWMESQPAQLILGQINLLQGKPTISSEIYSNLLVENGNILRPEELYEKYSDSRDLTIPTSPNLGNHGLYALALLRSKKFPELETLIETVCGWTEWMNGDWKVLYAESLRRQRLLSESIDFLDGMDDPPPHLTRALCFLELEDEENAKQHLNFALNNSKLGKYNHPEGSPDSIAQAIQSFIAHFNFRYEEAENFGREAVVLDPGCSLARLALSQAQTVQGREIDAVTELVEAIRRIPGEPQLVEQTMKLLVGLERFDEAEHLLSVQRPLLIEHGSEQLGFELGEFLALATKEARTKDEPLKTYQQMKQDWPWVEQLDQRSQHWLQAAYVFKNHEQLFLSALAVYLGKFCEHLLNKHIMEPFKSKIDLDAFQANETFSDISKFLLGDHPPSINGVVRLLKAAAKDSTDTDDMLVIEFRRFLVDLDQETRVVLTDKKFIQRLNKFGHLRNEAAHIGEPDTEKFNKRIAVILEDWKPGPLLNAFGIH